MKNFYSRAEENANVYKSVMIFAFFYRRALRVSYVSNGSRRVTLDLFWAAEKNRTVFLVVLDGKRELEKVQTALALHIEFFWRASFSSFAHIILACLISKTI